MRRFLHEPLLHVLPPGLGPFLGYDMTRTPGIRSDVQVRLEGPDRATQVTRPMPSLPPFVVEVVPCALTVARTDTVPGIERRDRPRPVHWHDGDVPGHAAHPFVHLELQRQSHEKEQP